MKPESNFYLYFSYTSALSILIPFLFGFFLRKNFTHNIKFLFLLISISLITELLTVIFQINNIHNLFIFRIYTLFQFIVLSFFFGYTLSLKRMFIFIRVIDCLFFSVVLVDIYRNGFNSTDELSL